ncbi:MAG: 30S ribosomal protein S15 [Candidatus Aenigmarchaeota archaeon]|nr:30S ribosomal protein S15 [Candidatus Aenigmarchaeota archaeon]
MARMHSRKHGQHGSKKPIKKIKVDWLIYDKDEVEKLILKLAKEGKSSAEIGLLLRDQYGIPDVRYFKMRVLKVIEKDHKKEVPEDLYNLIKKAVNVHKHMDSNRKDSKGKHGLELLESKIRRLGKYYARTGKLPKGWKYSIDEAKLLVK